MLNPLLAYALWACALLFVLFSARMQAMLVGKRGIETFRATGDTVRLDVFSRAHMSTVENLPIFAVVYLGALWTNAGAPVLLVGWICFGARVLQSLVHLNSQSAGAVAVRATLQAVQILSFIWLGVAALIAANR